MDAQPPSVTLASVADAVAVPTADLAFLSAPTGIQAALTRAASVVGLALAIATPALPVTCWQKETSTIAEFFYCGENARFSLEKEAANIFYWHSELQVSPG